MVSLDAWVNEVTPRIYGAALAVADDRDAAADVTAHVLARATVRGEDNDPEAVLADRAIALAVRAAPCAELEPMRQQDRVVVALARVRGRSVAQIAETLALDERAVRAAMTRGLRDAARAPSADFALELAS